MRSAFDHENLRVYQAAIEFVAWLEEVAAELPEKVSACDHLGRASAGVPVNIAQASGKRSMGERRQFIDTAYGSSLDKAATGVVLNIAEGNGKFSTKDRSRFIGHARTAALQAAATLDVHAVRQAQGEQAVIGGKKHLADVVSTV